MTIDLIETSFSHRITAYKIVGHFFGLSYRKISGSNQVKNSFFRISNMPVPCPHAQLRGRTVIKKLWTFFGPWVRDRSQSPPLDFSGKANTSIHGQFLNTILHFCYRKSHIVMTNCQPQSSSPLIFLLLIFG